MLAVVKMGGGKPIRRESNPQLVFVLNTVGLGVSGVQQSKETLTRVFRESATDVRPMARAERLSELQDMGFTLAEALRLDEGAPIEGGDV